MKKKFRFFALLLVLGIILSCGCSCKKDPVIKSISVVTESIPNDLLTTDATTKITNVQIEVVKSNKDVDKINISKSMISDDDWNKLSKEGTHTIKITYEGFETEFQVSIKKPSSGGPNDKEIEYSFYVEDIAGKPLSDFYVIFYLGNEKKAEGRTDKTGTFKAVLEPNIYEIIVEGRDGYYLNQEQFKTDLIGTPVTTVCEIDSLAGVEADEYVKYELGDVMYDFTLVDIDNNVLNLYDLIEDGKLVILNFWYTTCSACQYEFPYMIEAYKSEYTDKDGNTRKYSDDVVIIAINNGLAGGGDTPLEVENYRDSMGLNFNVAFDYDLNTDNVTMDPALTTMFNVEAYPTTVVIDKYGLIAELGEGAVTETKKWTQLFDTYLNPEYEPEYKGENGGPEIILPDKVQADSSVLEEAINGTNYDKTKYEGNWTPEDNADKDYSWPWEVVEFNGKNAIRPTNIDINGSFAIVYTKVYLKEGEVFAFDYFASSEESDKLYIVTDGTISISISGISSDWEKSYSFVAIEEKEYEFGFCYIKDSSYSSGDDSVYITNVRVEKEENIDQPTYIFREAATGIVDEFTMSYTNYVNVVYNENDGYYHVNDANGPLLLANMLGSTKWNSSNLYTIALEKKCLGFDGKDYNAVIEEYSVYASNSKVGYTPITKELANALQQVTKALGDKPAQTNENQWLEVCVYYSAYGTNGVELELPTVGVTYFEPIMFNGNGIEQPATATGDYNRIILPRGLIFGFTPEKSGVYKYYSTGDLETIGWICDDKGIVVAEEDMGLREYAKLATEGVIPDNNFVAYVYLEAGKTYLFRACFYDIYQFSEINVEMSYVAEKKELLTIASPGFFTSSTDEMADIISGNYVDPVLGNDGYYKVKDSTASDTNLYCDVIYLTNILGSQTIKEALEAPYFAFDFSKDEYGNKIYDSEGYLRSTRLDEEFNIVYCYVCLGPNGEYYYPQTLNEGEYTEANGYTYIKLTQEEIEAMKGADSTDYVKQYILENMITDQESELYGCVKVDEQFAMVLSLLMDKYTFEGVADSWLKLCYYYKYLGA